MVSNEALTAVFNYLEGLGYRRPDGWQNVSKAVIYKSWRHHFRNIDNGTLLTAAAVYVDSGATFWPNAGQLIALIPPSGPPIAGSDAAWTLAVEGMHDFRRGRHRPPWGPEHPWPLADRDDEHAAAVVALKAAGWVNLCNSDEERLRWAKRDFGIAFAAAMGRTTADRRWIEAGGAPLLLTGVTP